MTRVHRPVRPSPTTGPDSFDDDPALRQALQEAGNLTEPLPLSGIQDHRQLQVLDYWRRLKGARIGPRRQEIDPLEIWKALSQVTLVDVCREEGDGLSFRYRLAGTAICEIHGMELKGRLVTEVDPPAFGRSLWLLMRRVVEKRQPQFTRWRFTSREGYERSFEVLRLPLSEDGERVDGLLVAANYDAGSQQLRDFFASGRRGAA